MFNVQTFQIYRLTTTTGAKESQTDTGRTVSGRLEPLDTEIGALAGSAFSKSYRLFINQLGVDLKEGDQLKNGEDVYDVRGVQSFNHPPRHMEASLEKAIKQ